MPTKARLDKLRDDFRNFFEDPQCLDISTDEWQGREEKYSGLVVSAEGGNLVNDDGMQLEAFDTYSNYKVHPIAEKWLKQHRAEFDFYDAGTGFITLIL